MEAKQGRHAHIARVVVADVVGTGVAKAEVALAIVSAGGGHASLAAHNVQVAGALAAIGAGLPVQADQTPGPDAAGKVLELVGQGSLIALLPTKSTQPIPLSMRWQGRGAAPQAGKSGIREACTLTMGR